jgi:hypothetical protein
LIFSTEEIYAFLSNIKKDKESLSPMIRIGFIILAHKNPNQLRRLVDKLSSPFSKCFIHVDRKSDIKGFKCAFQDLNEETCIWLKRERSAWGSFGAIQATINGIIRALEEQPAVDYIFLLSGQDYPIKNLTCIQDFLAANNGKSFLGYSPLPSKYWYAGGMNRYEYHHFNFMGKWLTFPFDYYYHLWPKNQISPVKYPLILLAKIFNHNLGFWSRFKKKMPSDLKPFGGDAHWCISRSAASYIVDFVQRRKDMIRLCKYSICCDEVFFHVILLNSYLRDTIINKSLHYIIWKTDKPAIFTGNDFNRLSQSDCLFARKFDSAVDSNILDMIDDINRK